MRRRRISEKQRAYNREKRRVLRFIRVVMDSWSYAPSGDNIAHRARVDALDHIRRRIDCDEHRGPS